MQYKCVVSSVQCPVCSMKFTGACSGTGSVAGAVCSVQCAVCSVLSATGEELAVEMIFQIVYLKKVLGPKKFKPIICLIFRHHVFWFLETFVKKLSFNLINMIAT